jgi:hypothetical protein
LTELTDVRNSKRGGTRLASHTFSAKFVGTRQESSKNWWLETGITKRLNPEHDTCEHPESAVNYAAFTFVLVTAAETLQQLSLP